MRQKYIFHHDHYYHTLKDQIGNGIPVFHGVRQRGGGIGSVLGGIAKYALPLLMKWVMPHAKKAALSTVADVAKGGKSLKSSLKRNGLALLKDVGTDVLNSVRNKQIGKGLGSRQKKNRIKKKAASKPKPKSKASKTSKRKATAKKNSAKRTRLDIFV